MKPTTARELRNQFPIVAAWLDKGETVLLTRRGRPMGRINLPARFGRQPPAQFIKPLAAFSAPIEIVFR